MMDRAISSSTQYAAKPMRWASADTQLAFLGTRSAAAVENCLDPHPSWWCGCALVGHSLSAARAPTAR